MGRNILIFLILGAFSFGFTQDPPEINVSPERIVFSGYYEDGLAVLWDSQSTRALGPWFESRSMAREGGGSFVLSAQGSTILLRRNKTILRIYGEGLSEINRNLELAAAGKAHQGLSLLSADFSSNAPISMRISVEVGHMGLSSELGNYARFKLRGPQGFKAIDLIADANNPGNGTSRTVTGPPGNYSLEIEALTNDPFNQGVNYLLSYWWINFEAYIASAA